MSVVLADARWSGDFGIARVSRELFARLPGLTSLDSRTVRPGSPLDPIWLRRQIRAHRARCFFSPGYNAALSGIPQLLIVHDLIHLDCASETSLMKRRYYESLVRPAVRRTGLVVTVSEFSRTRLADWTGLPAERVLVARPGCSPDFLRAPTGTSPVALPYVLYVGNVKPYKNLPLLVEAVRRLHDWALVCVGVRSDASRSGLFAALDPGRVVLRTGVSDLELAALYRHAECVALPSSYEGFGLPALESLAQRTPVVYLAEAVAEIVTPALGTRLAADAGPDELATALGAAPQLRAAPQFAADRDRQLARFTWTGAAGIVQDALQSLIA